MQGARKSERGSVLMYMTERANSATPQIAKKTSKKGP